MGPAARVRLEELEDWEIDAVELFRNRIWEPGQGGGKFYTSTREVSGCVSNMDWGRWMIMGKRKTESEVGEEGEADSEQDEVEDLEQDEVEDSEQDEDWAIHLHGGEALAILGAE